MLIQGFIGAPAHMQDGAALVGLRQGKDAELIVQELHGKNYEQAARGNLFIGQTAAAGVAVPIFSATTQQYVLFNPPNSGINASIERVEVGYVSGTMVAGHLCFAFQSVVGATAPTGTTVQPLNALAAPGISGFTGGNKSGLVMIPATATVVALSYLRALRLSQVAQAATATNAPWIYGEDVNGSVVIPPGGTLAVAANAAAFVTATICVTWEEVKI